MTEGDFSCSQLPQENGEAPHVGGLGVDDFGTLGEGLRSHPSRMISLAAVLEGEGRVGHGHAGGQFVVGQNVNLERIGRFKSWRFERPADYSRSGQKV